MLSFKYIRQLIEAAFDFLSFLVYYGSLCFAKSIWRQIICIWKNIH